MLYSNTDVAYNALDTDELSLEHNTILPLRTLVCVLYVSCHLSLVSGGEQAELKKHACLYIQSNDDSDKAYMQHRWIISEGEYVCEASIDGVLKCTLRWA